MIDKKIKQILEDSRVYASKPISLKDEFSADWNVDSKGNLYHKRKDYFIGAERLTEKDWIKHMLSKGWIDMNTFVPAYFYALKVIGIKELTIVANYSLNPEDY